jgi:hypothetical protein
MDNQELATDIIITCPHCEKLVLIEKLNCCIFRHGTFINTGQQINPHASKEECEQLINTKQIYGCGKPFKIIIKIKLDTNDVEYITEVCDYI